MILLNKKINLDVQRICNNFFFISQKPTKKEMFPFGNSFKNSSIEVTNV